MMRQSELDEAIAAWAEARGMRGALHAEWHFEPMTDGKMRLDRIEVSSGQDLPKTGNLPAPIWRKAEPGG